MNRFIGLLDFDSTRGKRLIRRYPLDDLKPAVIMLNRGSTTLNPVAAIDVGQIILDADHSVMDVAADHPVGTAPPRFAHQRALELPDEVDRVTLSLTHFESDQ